MSNFVYGCWWITLLLQDNIAIYVKPGPSRKIWRGEVNWVDTSDVHLHVHVQCRSRMYSSLAIPVCTHGTFCCDKKSVHRFFLLAEWLFVCAYVCCYRLFSTFLLNACGIFCTLEIRHQSGIHSVDWMRYENNNVYVFLSSWGVYMCVLI